MQVTITPLTGVDCEACGGRGANLLTYSCGATAEMCPACRAYEIRQAALDAACALR
jgi:RecJ-like exonuclease